MSKALRRDISIVMSLLLLQVFSSFSVLAGDVLSQPVYKKIYNEDVLVAEGWTVDGEKDQYWKFYSNGVLESEGHFLRGIREGYWKFYSDSGIIKEEGHYCQNQRCQWWSFYDGKGELSDKCEFLDDQRHGFCIIYEDDQPVKAQKYERGEVIKTWTSYMSFMMDN